MTRRLIAGFARQPCPDPRLPPSLGALSPREAEVLRLIARGRSNAEISDTLIAEQTPKTHVGRILANSTSATAPRPSSSPAKPASSRPAEQATIRSGRGPG
jgi:DNA-binding CsgD family transcriptional regulator